VLLCRYWIGTGIAHSLIVFFFPWYILSDFDKYTVSVAAYSCLIFIGMGSFAVDHSDVSMITYSCHVRTLVSKRQAGRGDEDLHVDQLRVLCLVDPAVVRLRLRVVLAGTCCC